MSEARATILVVEDDEEMRRMLDEELREAGHDVVTAADGFQALERLRSHPIDVVVSDRMMPGMTGDELLEHVRAHEPDVPIVITTAFGSIESAVEAIKRGAFYYVAKPFRMEQLLATVENAVRERRLRREIASLRSELGARTERIVARSRPMLRILELVARAAAADTPVLLLGESGTGKELLARSLHERSQRGKRRFTAVNCSAIPDTLLESQLFGHRRGAFTDAREDRPGLFLETDGGTMLLDEIGDMPPALQAKLLRVLQEREVHPLGAAEPVPVDVRVVAATHRDLEALIAQGRFRSDLYYRLNVIAVRVPPLRERPEDLVPLVAAFLEKHGPRLGRPAARLTSDALDRLERYPWPGNVRELENVIEHALVLGRGDTIGVDDLPDGVRDAPRDAAIGPRALKPLAEIEQEHIRRALAAAGGNKTVAARLLGLDRKTLYRKLEQLDPPAR
jgi:DNA-binding NtrC family response regulator